MNVTRSAEKGPDRAAIEIRHARLEEIVELRHEVLRQGMPRDAAIFEADHKEDSRHYAAFVDSGRAVCCATVHASRWEGHPAWQLRGMATDAAWRRHGVGRDLLRWMEADLGRCSPVRLLWCNARVPAIAFYQHMGWQIVSEMFEIPTAGPHVRMTRMLESGR